MQGYWPRAPGSAPAAGGVLLGVIGESRALQWQVPRQIRNPRSGSRALSGLNGSNQLKLPL